MPTAPSGCACANSRRSPICLTSLTPKSSAERKDKEGRKEGAVETHKELLRDALEARFPEEGAALAAEFQGEQDVDRLKFLHRQAVLAQSPDDFRSRIASPS